MKRGRKHKPPAIPEKKIGELAALGCTNKEIAVLCELDVGTLTDNFSHLLDKGRELGKYKLRRLQMKSAINGNIAMQIWLGKQMLGQTDKTEITQPDDPLAELLKELRGQYEKAKDPNV